MPPIPDITERIPALLSARRTSTEAATSGVLYDVVVSGIGFTFAIDSRNPYVRQTERVEKQQIDTSTEAGEQTLGGPWIRSQTSWHLGAGADFYEPGNRDETTPSKFRFKDSRGVNPWVFGELTLHPLMAEADAAGAPIAVCGGRRNGADVWFSYTGTTVTRWDAGVATVHTASASSADATYGIVNAGSVLLIGGTTGVRRVNVSDGTVADLCTQAAGTAVKPYFAKGRIISTRGNVVHQHALAGGVIDSTSELFDHPDDGWVWSGVAETPDAVLAAGYSNGVSAIYAFVLAEDAGGAVPALGQPFQVTELPPGEEIQSIRAYLGRYLGIGTTAGIRVAVIGDSGQVQYGPLLLETDDPVVALEARDSYLYAATGSAVIRVNLAESIDDGLRFPYAYDVETPDGSDITSMAFDGVSDRVVVGCNGVGTFAASPTEHVTTGWLESGDIRYGTTVPKAFRTMDVIASTDATTSVSVATVVGGTQVDIVTISNGLNGEAIGLSSVASPLPELSYRLQLGGAGETPTVASVAVKAVPTPSRQRLVQLPVHLSDQMRDSRGFPFGGEGYATVVLEALEALETSGTIVSVIDLTRPEQFEATVEEVQFTRVEPRARGNGAKNFGGIAKITVKTL